MLFMHWYLEFYSTITTSEHDLVQVQDTRYNASSHSNFVSCPGMGIDGSFVGRVLGTEFVWHT